MIEHRFSDKSAANLAKVNPHLTAIVNMALWLCDVDFAVVCGWRSSDEQARLYAEGKSQSLNSNHMQGRAVDLVPYIGGKACWDIGAYIPVVIAMARAARLIKLDENRVSLYDDAFNLRWGGAWTCKDIALDVRDEPHRVWGIHDRYIRHCKKSGEEPFIDCPHFEIGYTVHFQEVKADIKRRQMYSPEWPDKREIK